MKLVNMDLGIDIDIEENNIYELIIEHEDSFSKAVGSLVNENGRATVKRMQADFASISQEASVFSPNLNK